MFVTESRYRKDTRKLARTVEEREQLISTLQARIAVLEKSRHDIVEATRYVIESASEVVSDADPACGEDLRQLAHTLPYLLSRRRCWEVEPPKGAADGHRSDAEAIASKNGFRLPEEPVAAVMAMLKLALALFNPEVSRWLVEGLKVQYPLEELVPRQVDWVSEENSRQH